MGLLLDLKCIKKNVFRVKYFSMLIVEVSKRNQEHGSDDEFMWAFQWTSGRIALNRFPKIFRGISSQPTVIFFEEVYWYEDLLSI